MIPCCTFSTASFASDRAPTKKAEYGYSITIIENQNQEIPEIQNNLYCLNEYIEWRESENLSTIKINKIHFQLHTSKNLQKVSHEKKLIRATIRYLPYCSNHSLN